MKYFKYLLKVSYSLFSFTEVFKTFTQYFVEASLAAVTVAIVLGYFLQVFRITVMPFITADPLKWCQIGK